ncbi:polysaccharide biosynthesis C-terminal domain-containing protein [Mycoplasmatota bacterium zrk1]
MSILKKIYLNDSKFNKNLIYSSLGFFTEKVMMFSFSIVFVKYLGTTLWGEYSYIVSVVQLISIFALFGLNTGIIYFYPKNGNRYFTAVFVLNFIISIFLIVLGNAFILKSELLLLMIWLVSASNLFLAIHRATGKLRSYYIIRSFLLYALMISSIILLHNKNWSSENNMRVSVLTAYILSVISFILINYKHFGKIYLDKKLVVYSLPLFITAVSGVLMNKIDIIMLGNTVDFYDIGVYTITAQIAILPSYILSILNTVFAPEISKAHHNDNTPEMIPKYISYTRIVSVLSIGVILFILIFRNFIFGFYNLTFQAVGVILIIKLAGHLFNNIVGPVWSLITLSGKSKLNMYGIASATVINVVLNLILIPMIGILGAAIATTVSLIYVNSLGYILVKKIYKVKLFIIV